MFKFISVTLLALFLCSCATYYKEAPSSSPHALLTFEKGKGFPGTIGSKTTSVLEINGTSPNRYTKLDFSKFKLHPGKTTLLLHIPGNSEVEGVTHLRFNAEAGETYKIYVESKDTEYLVKAVTSSGRTAAASVAQKTRKTPSQTIFIPVVY